MGVLAHTPHFLMLGQMKRLRRITGAATLAFAIALMAGGGQAWAGKFSDLLAEAQKAREAGDLTKTASLLRQAIAIKPLPTLYNNLGRVLEDMGEDAFETMTYYERWMNSVTQNLIQTGVISLDELNAKMTEIKARGATYGEAQGVGE